MKRFQRIRNKLLFPRTVVLVLGVPLAAVLLGYVLLLGHEEEPWAYLVFLLAAYMMTVLCARVPTWVKQGLAFVQRFHALHRFLTDAFFRAQVSLYLSLWANCLFALMNFGYGLCCRSLWFAAIAVYYLLLAILRFLLLRGRKQTFVSELKSYRCCGILLLGINVWLTVIVYFMVRQNRGRHYPGTLIYAAAAYAFYTVTAAAVNMVKSRRHNRPSLAATKAVSLASALVSILSLETAMLAQFGGSDRPAFRQGMTAATGAGVCALVLSMAVFMIARSTKQLKKAHMDFNKDPHDV